MSQSARIIRTMSPPYSLSPSAFDVDIDAPVDLPSFPPPMDEDEDSAWTSDDSSVCSDGESDMVSVDLFDKEIGKDRDHPPPPELLYSTLEEAVQAASTWGWDHGVHYRRHKWMGTQKNCCRMVCTKAFKPPKPTGKMSRAGVSSGRTDRRMHFFIKSLDP